MRCGQIWDFFFNFQGEHTFFKTKFCAESESGIFFGKKMTPYGGSAPFFKMAANIWQKYNKKSVFQDIKNLKTPFNSSRQHG